MHCADGFLQRAGDLGGVLERPFLTVFVEPVTDNAFPPRVGPDRSTLVAEQAADAFDVG